MTGRAGRVYQREALAGRIEERAGGYRFTYDPTFLVGDLPAVSLTLPKRARTYESPHLFPFFVSLLAEGNLAAEQCRRLRLDERDLFGRLLHTTAGDVIGSVRVVAEEES